MFAFQPGVGATWRKQGLGAEVVPNPFIPMNSTWGCAVVFFFPGDLKQRGSLQRKHHDPKEDFGGAVSILYCFFRNQICNILPWGGGGEGIK